MPARILPFRRPRSPYPAGVNPHRSGMAPDSAFRRLMAAGPEALPEAEEAPTAAEARAAAGLPETDGTGE